MVRFSRRGADPAAPMYRPTRPSYILPHLRSSWLLSASTVKFSPSSRNPNSNSLYQSRPSHLSVPVETFSNLDIDGVGVHSGGGGGINFDAYEDISVETSSSNVSRLVGTFLAIDLGKALVRNMGQYDYVRLVPVQRHAIPILLAGRDLMACAQTGSGKTTTF